MPRRTQPPVIPCELRSEVEERIASIAVDLKAHALEMRGEYVSEAEALALFHAAIERLRGQQAATMDVKRAFVNAVLEHLRGRGLISGWSSVGSGERHDYEISMGDRTIVVEAKGCLDGNNTNIFQRPPNADEFYIWSLCQNPGADPRHNVWSGVHTRLGAEVIARRTQVDALIVWDMLCGTIARPCPKVIRNPERRTKIGDWNVPPPCVYLFPRTIPDPRNNQHPPVWQQSELRFASALSTAFHGTEAEATSVSLATRMQGDDVVRTTTLTRAGEVLRESSEAPIRRARA